VLNFQALDPVPLLSVYPLHLEALFHVRIFMLRIMFGEYPVIAYFHMYYPISAHFLGSFIPSQLCAWPLNLFEFSFLKCQYRQVIKAFGPFNPFPIILNPKVVLGLIFYFQKLILGLFVIKSLPRAFFDIVLIKF